MFTPSRTTSSPRIGPQAQYIHRYEILGLTAYNRNIISFTSKPLQIDVINMICRRQQPIKCIFKITFCYWWCIFV